MKRRNPFSSENANVRPRPEIRGHSHPQTFPAQSRQFLPGQATGERRVRPRRASHNLKFEMWRARSLARSPRAGDSDRDPFPYLREWNKTKQKQKRRETYSPRASLWRIRGRRQMQAKGRRAPQLHLSERTSEREEEREKEERG